MNKNLKCGICGRIIQKPDTAVVLRSNVSGNALSRRFVRKGSEIDVCNAYLVAIRKLSLQKQKAERKKATSKVSSVTVFDDYEDYIFN